MYVQYVSHTSKSAVIVFDGYDNLDSTKQSEQQRREHQSTVQHNGSNPLSVAQETLLANIENKKNSSLKC